MAVKKKLKLSKKGMKLLGIVGVLLLLIVVPFTYVQIQKNEIASYGYSKEAVDVIFSQGLKDYASKHKDNKALDKALSSKDFKKENIDIYAQVSYQDQEQFTKHINELFAKGYSVEEIDAILKTGNDEDITSFLEKDYQPNTLRYLKYDYAKLAYLDRYKEYQAKTVAMDQDAVVQVNIGLDRDFYEDAIEIHDFSIDVLANKYRKLSENYVPDDLVEIPSSYCINGNQYMSRVAEEAFIKMVDDASKEGLTMRARSSYRTYQQQESLYNDYVKLYGSKRADEIAARPGFSEHQTGLVIDIAQSETSVFANTKEYKWLTEHAHEYGFILRYPKGKEKITGYSYEAWHFRYVGVEIATYMKENNLTFDEYYVMFIDK